LTRTTENSELALAKREMDLAAAALATAGAGSIGNLECRMADLQVRFLTTPARTLPELSLRLEAIRSLVAGLGEPGYLLQLIDATLDDLRRLSATAARE